MPWAEKLHQTRLAVNENPRLRIVFDSSDPAPEAFVSSLAARYPFLPESYLRFLRQTDGAQLWMYVLAGSGESSFTSIEQLFKRWQPNLRETAMAPIGEDPSGACLAITKGGNVVLIDYMMDSPDDAIAIAASFDELLDELLMGDRFPSLVGGLTPDDENEWTQLLRQQGWLSSP